MQTDRRRIGANIAAEMRRAGWTQHDLGALLNMRQPAVSRRISGETAFDAEQIPVIAAALHVTVEALLSGSTATPAAAS